MIVVADASPLIFLAKVRRLDLIYALLGADILVPVAVREELLPAGVDRAEEVVLEAFLATCRVETVRRPRRFASVMSRADNAALTLAIRRRAAYILCDERAMRRMAETEGIRPLGTLGVLLRAMRREIIGPDEAKRLIDLLVGTHGFRIGIELYQAAMAEIERRRP
jgi:predicted nucleic acid-binding protein